MNVTVEHTAPDEAVVRVEVEAERVDQAVRSALGRLAQRYVFPGFRRGKAPRNIVESFLGRDAIYQDALSQLIEVTFDEAIDQEQLRPVAPADIEGEPDLAEGSPLTYTARVAVRPDVAFPDVRGLNVDVPSREITEADVDRLVESMRRQRAKPVAADKVGEHSLVRAEITTEVAGEVVEEPREGLLDMEEQDPVITGLNDALAGSPVGETREVVWTVPDDNPQHAGQEALTRIRVLDVQDRQLPDLDEALAKEMGAESIEDLRQRARAYLAIDASNHERQERLDKAVEGLVDAVEATAPEPLVERQSDILWEEFLSELRRQHIPLEAFRAASGKDEAAVREGFRPQAERRAKRNMVLEALADREGLVPVEGEMRAAADRLLGGGEKGRRDARRTLSRGQRTYIRDVLMREKALTFLAGIYAPDVEDDQAGSAARKAEAGPEAG